MTQDEIREAVEQAEVDYHTGYKEDGNRPWLNFGIAGVFRDEGVIVDANFELRMTPTSLLALYEALRARARPVFGALSLLKSVQQGGEWRTVRADKELHLHLTDGCVALVCDTPPLRLASEEYFECKDAADLLYRTFGPDKLAAMYAPNQDIWGLT